MFAGDFYRFRTRTVDLVKAMRALAVDSGIHQPELAALEPADRRAERNEPVLGEASSQERVADWAAELDIPVGGETILFVDCEAAFYRTSQPRAVAQMLQAAGVEFGLMREQWCCGGPAAEMGYVEQARRFAEHNVADWRAVGAKRILVLDPHDYITFTEDYPKYFGDDFDFEIVLVDRAGRRADPRGPARARPSRSSGASTYHDPCRLNKRKGIHREPRELMRAIPGLTFQDVDHVTQWSYCSGAGGGLRIEKPEITAAISARRHRRRPRSSTSTCWCRRACGRSGRWPSRARRGRSRCAT